MVTKSAQCKLADFGSAQRVIKNDLGEIDKIIGSCFWMAPEVIKQTGLTFAADIWSFGATVYEMLTGDPPFYDKKATQWTIMHRIAGTEELPYLDENFSDVAQDFIYLCLQ